MFGLRKSQSGDDLLSSSLLDQTSFYGAFEKDLARAKREVIVESPFISFKRLNRLLPTFRKLARRGVKVIINTSLSKNKTLITAGRWQNASLHCKKLGLMCLLLAATTVS